MSSNARDERHSFQDALSVNEMDQLVVACVDLDEPYHHQCRVILVLLGRLGLRAGEAVHLSEDWINWHKKQIQIPSHDPCTIGRAD